MQNLVFGQGEQREPFWKQRKWYNQVMPKNKQPKEFDPLWQEKLKHGEAMDRKRKRHKDKLRQEWASTTQEGQQIRKMGFRASYIADDPEWYKEYLKSEHWKKKQAEYRASSLPQECLICGNKKFEIHHRSYDRIGAELLSDFAPLCRTHHAKTHELVKKGVPLWTAHEQVS